MNKTGDKASAENIQLYFLVGKYQLNIDIFYFINYHTGNYFVNNNFKSVNNSLQ